MKLNIPQTICDSDLCVILNQVDTCVYPRTKGRTTAQTEKWVMHRYLEEKTKTAID